MPSSNALFLLAILCFKVFSASREGARPMSGIEAASDPLTGNYAVASRAATGESPGAAQATQWILGNDIRKHVGRCSMRKLTRANGSSADLE